jgi:hypothetical protein
LAGGAIFATGFAGTGAFTFAFGAGLAATLLAATFSAGREAAGLTTALAAGFTTLIDFLATTFLAGAFGTFFTGAFTTFFGTGLATGFFFATVFTAFPLGREADALDAAFAFDFAAFFATGLATFFGASFAAFLAGLAAFLAAGFLAMMIPVFENDPQI